MTRLADNMLTSSKTYSVRHLTRLNYRNPVNHAEFNLRLAPYGWPGQWIDNQQLLLTPMPAFRRDQPGPYCVNASHIAFTTPLSALEVLSTFTATLDTAPEPGNGPRLVDLRQETLAERDLSPHAPAPYLFTSRIAGMSTEIGAWAAPILAESEYVVPAASALMGAVHSQFSYRTGATDAGTPPEQAFASREGVCQDFAHVMIMALRSHGIAAAYASGYLRTLPPPGQPRLVGADAMHAWVNVWCGRELGWIGLDPTNNCLARQDHIQIGMGRDYADVAPIDGIFIGTNVQDMQTEVDVEELC